MNWYYVDNGQQAGPVDDAALEALVASGKVKPDTLVWHEGMAAWTAYGQIVPTAVPPAGVPPVAGATPQISQPTAAGNVVCSECGRSFPPSEVIKYADKYVCGNCKPLFFQRLREGGGAGAPGTTGMATEADLLARDYEVDIGGCLSRAWELFKANAGIMIGATVLVYLVLMAANGIPYLNTVLGLLLNGPLIGGLWFFYVKKTRNQDATIGDAFSGFGPKFWQLVLTQLIPGLITGAFIILLAAIAVPTIILGNRGNGGGPSTMMWITLGVLIPLALVVMTYLNVCWMFALPLVIDKGLKFWPALELSRRVVNKHWWMTFFLVVVSGVLGIVGFICCCVGLLITGPVAFAMFNYHYQRVFGDLAPQG